MPKDSLDTSHKETAICHLYQRKDSVLFCVLILPDNLQSRKRCFTFAVSEKRDGQIRGKGVSTLKSQISNLNYD